jgi:hypothetical protein
MRIPQIIAWARRYGRIQNGIVLCGNCDNPALKSAAVKMSWVGCGACYFGETDAIDYEDIITIKNPHRRARRQAATA